ncbi:MAG: CbiQ family ECF transporter T component [Archaeoglobaceae archaeon]
MALILTLISQKVQFFNLVVFTSLGIFAVREKYFKIIELPALFFFASIFLILITIDGEKIFEFWIFRVSDNALNIAVSTIIRVFASLSILAYLISTTTLPEFVSALKKLKIPHFMLDMMFLSYRAIQVLFSEAKKFEVSAASRLGFSSFKNSLSSISLLSRMLFLRAMGRVEKTLISIESRNGEEIPVLRTESRGKTLAFALTLVMVIFLCWK